jgi:hypothetical protein
VADVISCVNFARENEMLLAIRGGSHNGAGWAGSGAQELAQLTALFTSAPILASSVAVNSFSANEVAGACSYCASSFGVKEEVEKSNVPLLEEYAGHPSLQKLVSEGYQVITF